MSIYKSMSNEDLNELLRVTDAEIESLEYTKSQIENEIFYRNNPECRSNP